MKSIKNIRIVCAIIFFPIIMQLTGCSGNYINDNEAKTLDYTVIEETQIPEEFLNQIMEKKGESFELTYRDNEYLYIAKGYGEQETSGYSVAVTNLTTENEVVYFDSKLLEPQENENLNHNSSFPHVVIKTELIEFPVIFK